MRYIFLIILVYILFSVIKLPHPGVNNDQLMFIDAATGNNQGEFIWKSVSGVPVMIFPYIGALKSYLYLPIFNLFGVSIYSIRLPHIFLTALSLYLLYRGLKLNINYLAAVLTILFLSIDPNFIGFMRIDTGPNVLEFLFKIIALYLLFSYLKKPNVWYLILITPVLLLGVFNKLNFFWFVNAFLVATVVCYGQDIKDKLSRIWQIRILIYGAISYFFCLWFFIKISREVSLSYQGFSDSVSLSNISSNLPILIDNLFRLLDGSALFKLVYGASPTPVGGIYLLIFLAVTFYGSYLIYRDKNSLYRKQWSFYLLIIAVTALQILLTKKATQPWHTLALYPFLTIIFVLSLIKIYQAGVYIKYLTLAVGLMVNYSVVVNFLYLMKYSQPTKLVAYSSSIYDLIDYTKSSPKKFVCLDTDICNQLRSFDQKTDKYSQPLTFSDKETFLYTFSTMLGKFQTPNEYLYITHSETNSHFPDFRTSLFNYIDNNYLNRLKIRDLKDGDNTIFEIWKIGYFK